MTVYSTEIVSREHAHGNKWLGMDNTPAERHTHKNIDLQPAQLVRNAART